MIILNEIDKSFLRRFAEEDGMVEAVKKGILNEIDLTNFLIKHPLSRSISGETSNEVLGQQYRAFLEAIGMIDYAMNELAKYKGRANKKDNFNLER